MQCPQCRQANDHNARFCVQCGARVRASTCAACGAHLPYTARFCPECGTAVAASAARSARDPADALLAVRDADGIEEDTPTAAEADLVERVRGERSRARTIHHSVIVAGVALLVLVAALALPRRTSHSPTEPSPPRADTAAESPAPRADVAVESPAPRTEIPASPPSPQSRAAARAPRRTEADNTAASVPRRIEAPKVAAAGALELPERGARETTPRELAGVAPPSEPAAMPRAVMPRAVTPSPDVRVEVAQKATNGAVDYRVRVSRPDGAAVSDADVRLRGVMTDGTRVEARLEPAAEPGVYHSLLSFSAQGPKALTLRVARADGVVEVPVSAPASGGAPAKP